MQPISALPNYLLDQNAVLRDEGVSWRHGSVPDYSMANAAFETGKRHPACLVKRETLATYAFAVVPTEWLLQCLVGFRNCTNARCCSCEQVCCSASCPPWPSVVAR